MKNFYKILAAFLLVFTIGFLITYISINSTFNNISHENLITDIPSSLLKNTSKVFLVTF